MKSLVVQASDDIVMYALNKILFSSESYLAIPVDVTGYDYYIMTAEVADGGKYINQENRAAYCVWM